MYRAVIGSKGDSLYSVLSVMPGTQYSISNSIYFIITSWQLAEGLIEAITRIRSIFSHFPFPYSLRHLHNSLSCFFSLSTIFYYLPSKGENYIKRQK